MLHTRLDVWPRLGSIVPYMVSFRAKERYRQRPLCSWPWLLDSHPGSIASTQNAGAAVEVQGLDDNYVDQTEVVPIGGTGTIVFSRIFRARMVDTNNDADVTLSLNGSVVAKILEDKGQTLMAVYTVPAGKTAYLIKIQMGSDKASTNASLQYTLFARPFGGTFNVKGISYAAGGQNVVVEYPVPLKFEEKTDIKIDVIAASGGQTCSGTFDIILIDNPT